MKDHDCMEWLRWQKNPWGQDMLRGLAWEVTWLAIAVGCVCMVVHMLLYVWRWRSQTATGSPDAEPQRRLLPERILRHTFASRLFHWSMAAAVIVLLLTAFLPIVGVKFAWVTPHWSAGLVLTGAIVFHIVHASFWKGLAWMWVNRQDLHDGWVTLRQTIGLPNPAPGKPGKNPLENKLFHHLTSVATLATIVTGLLMMLKVDSPIWSRNPYLLADRTWGVVYVVHGVASVALITLVMVHVYFAVRPEKRWLTRSMIVGWIPRQRYLEHYDPARWPVLQPDDQTQGGEH